MKHARGDYNERFGDDPALANPALLRPGCTAIARDEPVMLFRAQDRNFILVLRFYRLLLWLSGSKQMAWLVDFHVARAKNWRHRNAGPRINKAPDVPWEVI